MALFLNCTIQGLLEDCSDWMPCEQLDRLTSRLNKRNVDSLSATWELVIAHSLSRHGEVQYEPRLGASTVADILFKQAETKVEFLSDVTLVSDEGLDEQNPSWDFAKELFRRVRRRGLATKNIFYTIGNMEVGEPGKKKIVLKMPKKSDFKNFFQRFIDLHLDQIRLSKPRHYEIHVTSEGYDIHLMYDVEIPAASGQHRVYSDTLHLTVNPLSNKLKEKARQLRSTGYDGIMGIFLCDAGSSLLGREISRSIKGSFSEEDIIWEFLRQNSSISFVQSYYTVEKWEMFQTKRNVALRGKLFVNRAAKHTLPEAVQNMLLELPSVFPKPVETGLSAYQNAKVRARLRRSRSYSTLIWGTGMVKLPARALVDLLAGRLGKDEFEEMMRTNLGGKKNIVDRELRQGNALKKIYIEENQDADDDWIVLEFDFDPAAGRFVNPSRGGIV